MTGCYGVWSQSKPRAEPAEGPPSATVRGSGRTPRHSQGPPPGAERRGTEVKLLIFKANTLKSLQLTVHQTPSLECRSSILSLATARHVNQSHFGFLCIRLCAWSWNKSDTLHLIRLDSSVSLRNLHLRLNIKANCSSWLRTRR